VLDVLQFGLEVVEVLGLCVEQELLVADVADRLVLVFPREQYGVLDVELLVE